MCGSRVSVASWRHAPENDCRRSRWWCWGKCSCVCGMPAHAAECSSSPGEAISSVAHPSPSRGTSSMLRCVTAAGHSPSSAVPSHSQWPGAGSGVCVRVCGQWWVSVVIYHTRMRRFAVRLCERRPFASPVPVFLDRTTAATYAPIFSPFRSTFGRPLPPFIDCLSFQWTLETGRASHMKLWAHTHNTWSVTTHTHHRMRSLVAVGPLPSCARPPPDPPGTGGGGRTWREGDGRLRLGRGRKGPREETRLYVREIYS